MNRIEYIRARGKLLKLIVGIERDSNELFVRLEEYDPFSHIDGDKKRKHKEVNKAIEELVDKANALDEQWQRLTGEIDIR